MIKTNYHTHSTYCDGKNTLEEMILSAISKDIKILGFSGHCMFPYSSDWHMPANDVEAYVNEVKALKEKYSSQIKILLGFEADYIPGLVIPSMKEFSTFNPDYLIGSVHYVYSEKGTFTVDESPEGVKKGLENVYGGNVKKLCHTYFDAQRQMLKKGDFQILGHPDLIRKNNGQLNMFTEKESWYIHELKETAKAIEKAGVIVEINTGAIARKKMDDVYPSAMFLEMLCQRKVPVTICSDCHNAPDIDCAFDKALESAIKAGYKELAYLDENANIKFQTI